MSATIVVTAVGGGVGQSILKCLKDTPWRTAGVDLYTTAAGLYLADEGFIGKPAADPEYIPRLMEVCEQTSARYVFPGMDAELQPLAENAHRFAAIGTTVVVSPPQVIELSDNKLALNRFLESRGITCIPTAQTLEEAEQTLTPPYIVKPAVGCRSIGVRRVEDLKQANLQPGEIIQEYIPGDEYTCGSVSFDGQSVGVIAMRRELRGGDTYKAYVDQNPVVLDVVQQLIQIIKPVGPCNFQLRCRDGRPYLLEMNARCSGTTAARMLAGFNEPLLTVNLLEGYPVLPIDIRPIEVYRYWNEVAVTPDDRGKIRRSSGGVATD